MLDEPRTTEGTTPETTPAPRGDAPRTIRLHETDNVAIVVNAFGLPAGTVFPDGLVLQEFVPQGHKVALRDIQEGAEIRRYGEVIGTALRAIPRGGWVEESRVHTPIAPDLDQLPLATRVPAPLPPLDGYTFEGYRNPDGSVGTRNILAISTSVQCVAGTLEVAIRRIKKELLPHFPNVDDVIGLTHAYGCGVAINAPQAVIPIRTLQSLAQNPNFGGEVMVVGLGCEKLVSERLLPDGQSDGVVRLQDERHEGFGMMLDSIMAMAEARLAVLNTRQRETCPAADLVVGLQCGGSDAFSGVTANPALGFAADLLVRAGATVMFSEVTEVRDAIHLLTPRAETEAVARALVREMAWYDDYLAQGGADRSANPSPGNKKGGLNNIVEKALGSVAKSGTSAIRGVLAPGERVRQKGLIFAATPASDFVCGTLQLASGITLQVFSTGRGTPYGLAEAPVIKVATRTELSQRWSDLIDLDAGKIATGEVTIEETGWELFRLILDVASGRKKPWSDHWGLYNDLTLFNPAPIT
ncbi:galactarate dehydratase [Methylobacterium frigidaeris]|uniref:Galactarate dehydratase n=1 Tax=Methylobacterium frigidaeris TaxID=2038277 RepID=A0AA37M7X5_9HYPH|nr:galactarate dehydratase [Methylobacterium frigidaeris]PIK69024.1 galactarate dehydratase [Methylobacterium frigidaeris]GJD65587.1 Galactarate dehydratase (L-threo-forming) [Methylobacterium frigidaeris]